MNPSAASSPTTLPRALQPVVAHIDRHLTEPLSLQRLAGLAGLSVWRFAIVFRQHMGVPPHRYISQQRIAHAQRLLRQGMAAADVADACGFYDQSHFSRHFKNVCNMTPGQYLAGLGRPGGGSAAAGACPAATPIGSLHGDPDRLLASTLP